MVTIYCTTSYWNYGMDGVFDPQGLSERELLDFLEKNDTRLIKVVSHQNSIFRERFIEPHLDKYGYLSEEGIFNTKLCGKIIVYRLIIDGNAKNARNKSDMGEKIEMGLSTLYCDGKPVGIGKIETSGFNVKAEKPIPAREWKPKNLSAEFTLNIEENEQVRKFAKMLADDAAKAVNEYNQKIALACEVYLQKLRYPTD